MSNVRISQLPTGSALTGTELVPVVQNGQTIQTTVSSFTSSPTLTQTFVTVNNTPSLANSRYFAVGTGIGLTDTGAQGQLRIALNGTSASLESVGNGFIAKTAANTVANRTFSTNSGLSITNGDGISGNPVLSVTGLLSALAATTGTGLMATAGGSTITPVTIAGTSNQTSVSNGNTSPVIGLADNPVIPGTASITVPSGTTAQRTGSTNGQLRYNTTTATFEGYANNVWGSITTGTGVTSIATGTGLTGGPITSTGTISIADTAVTAGSYTTANITVNAQGQITAAANGAGGVTSFSAGSTGLTPATATTGAIALAGTLVPASGGTGATTLTGYVYGNGTSTMTASATIPNAGLANSSVTVGTTSIALGATSLTLGGLTSVAVTQDPVSALQLATKQYVDAVAQNLNIHAACAAATTASLASLTGGTVTYNNGTSGVGATLTLSVALTTVDGYTLVNGNRLLVKNEVSTANNGIYTWATGGTVLTRATDFDTNIEIASGDFTFISNGTLYANTGWVQTLPVTTVGTSPIVFVQFSGAGTYSAGTGLTLTGSQFSLTAPVTAALGGTGYTSYTAGDMLYASASTTLSKLAIGTVNYVLTSSGSAPQYVAQSTLAVGTATNIAGGAAGSVPYNTASGATSFLALGTSGDVLTAGASAPAYVAQSTLSVGTATNATNTAITAASSGATNYLTFVTATTGNLPQLVNSSITCNAATGAITGGISGGTF